MALVEDGALLGSRQLDMGNSGLGDTKPIRQWALTDELRKRLKGRFDLEGIEIPWPHMKVYFGNGAGDRVPSGPSSP